MWCRMEASIKIKFGYGGKLLIPIIHALKLAQPCAILAQGYGILFQFLLT